MSDYSAEDFRGIVATSDGYKAVVKGEQKNLERSNPQDAEEIALSEFRTINKPSV